MRSLSLVECIEVKFTGKILKEGVCLGDCDNDGLNELVVGNTEGDLFIYRGDRCICKSTDLGTISAIAVGDLLNVSRNVTVVITIEGWCHIFDVEYELNLDDMKDDLSSIDASAASIAEFKVIQPFHSQRIVCNIKGAKLGDVNNDGKTELIVGLTDRVLRTYQWCSELEFEEGGESEDKFEDQRSENSDLVFNGKLKALNKWEFANQIGSVALHKLPDQSTCILVGQPGGTVSKLSNSRAPPPPHSEGEKEAQGLGEKDASNTNPRSRNPSNCSTFEVEHYSLNLGKMQNPNASTEVVGNVFSSEATEEADHYAVATLDGTIMLCHEDSFEIVTQLESPVLALEGINGSFVVIGWEGETYLVKRTLHPEVENCIIRFNFEESVSAFKVGPYAISQNDQDDVVSMCNQNCFIYATFHESIYIYPNQFV